MAHDSLDSTRGYPQYASTGAPSDAADLSEIAAWAGANIDRAPVATVAALGTAYTYVYTGMVAKVSVLPGCFFQYNGASWDMVGVPYLASMSALTAAIPTPVTGMLVQITTERFVRRWSGTKWLPWGTTRVPIIPVVGSSSGTAPTIDSDGVCVLAGTTALRLDSIFSTDFDRVIGHIEVTAMSAAAGSSIAIQLTDASHSPVGGTAYNNELALAINASASAVPQTGPGGVSLVVFNVGHLGQSDFEIDNAAAAAETLIKGDYFSSLKPITAAGLSRVAFGSIESGTAARDGLSFIFTNSSAMTGKIWFEGVVGI